MPRLFTALEIPDDLKDFVRKKSAFMNIRTVNMYQFHLTIRFIGDADEEHTERLRKSFSIVFEGTPKIPLNINGAGFFPDIHRARVFYLSVLSSSEMQSMKEKMDSLLLNVMGMDDEKRPFQPHLTLARFGIPPDAGKIEKMMTHAESLDFPHVKASRLVLFESRLTGSGAIHTPLAEQLLV